MDKIELQHVQQDSTMKNNIIITLYEQSAGIARMCTLECLENPKIIFVAIWNYLGKVKIWSVVSLSEDPKRMPHKLA